ncbi:MAG: glycerol kinase GlpK [Rhodothermales bacterium]|nr:glycerol kinase GlpK [Rhodothermales bacterium]MBO6778575.1 glycerol kinase GlpK [Rhodothermales bacterium]
MRYILALDQGTTSSRAILFDKKGSPAGVAQQEFTQHFPQPGWVEHDATEIWQTQLAVARQVLEEQSVDASQIDAIGITNQRETVVLWDRATGEPVHNALVWQDRRTADFCDALKAAGHAETIQAKTGLVIDPYFSGTKLRWLLDNVPGARDRAARGELCFGTIDAWLVYCLTGGDVHVTDASNASRTLLLNIHEGKWDPDLLDILDIPEKVLPRVRSSSEIYGHTSLLGADIPIAGMAGDQQAALFGQACHESGMAKNTYGTGCFMLMNTGTEPIRSQKGLLTTIAWDLGGETIYALEGSVFIAGAVVQWLRDGLQIIDSAPEIEQLAADDNGGVYFVPAFVGLGTPYWDPYARGTMIGMTRGTTRAHVARAALESIAFQSQDVIRAMASESGIELSELRVDGGATANGLLMQIQADLLGTAVVRPTVQETTALGAAYLAGLATGFWESLEQISRLWDRDKTFEPDMDREKAQQLTRQWRRAVERSGRWATTEGDA